ncbi:hypothetical protein AcW1_007164 [Taiwanofungus camphoratus]|nr:hypothetical protein AcV7_004994 [Antrodia cinnamomea]KAI0952766.1 hypothetical protein AcW1_007164 [Antrodia cinnamomea]
MERYQGGSSSSAYSKTHRNDLDRWCYWNRLISWFCGSRTQLAHRYAGSSGLQDALRYGGPIGALIGYSIIGSVVYCLCVSIGEMIAFLPNVGGVVGLADLYVDPALGFSLGWAAWYNWSVTLPAEVTAAALTVGFWDTAHVIPVTALTAIFLCLALALNLLSTRTYGEFEYWFSFMKVVTIVSIILVSLIIDMGAGAHDQGDGDQLPQPVFLHNWSKPFASSYLGICGAKGRFLGFLAVLMQASFSFFGSEVPGIAAGEVIDATRNVPRALERVWVRITLFYIGGIFSAGLLVPQSDSHLALDNNTGASSPFVIALNRHRIHVLPHIVNAAIMVSAWSAAASDIYISSRFLYFLAFRGHAPQFLKVLIKHPHHASLLHDEEETVNGDDSDSDASSIIDIRHHGPYDSSDFDHSAQVNSDVMQSTEEQTGGHNESVSSKKPYLVLPFASIMASASIGLLGFLSGTNNNAGMVFQWLVSVASVASMQSWAGMLFTYIRWHQGTVYAENKHKDQSDERSTEVINQISRIRKHRHKGQPYLAYYAFSICTIVLFANGWSVFVHNDWRIADTVNNTGPSVPSHYCSQTSDNDYRVPDPVSVFLSSYMPIPFFMLLTFGYKLVHQTKMVKLDEMDFSRQNVPEFAEHEEIPRNIFDKILQTIV